MTYTIDDRLEGSQFDARMTGGMPTIGSLLIVEATDGTDRRVYKVVSATGNALAVERQSISTAVFL